MAKQGTKSQKPAKDEPSFSLQPQASEVAFLLGGQDLPQLFLGMPVNQDHIVESLLCEIC